MTNDKGVKFMEDKSKGQIVKTQDTQGNEVEVKILGRKGDIHAKGVKQVGGQQVKNVETVEQRSGKK